MKTAVQLYEDLSRLFDDVGAGKVSTEVCREQARVANAIMRLADLQRKVGVIGRHNPLLTNGEGK